jgi:small GTP-binding protein
MPTNVSPEYFKAEERYQQAKTIEEKILATQELIRVAPKHKGTEKLLMTLKKRLAKLRAELQKQQSRRVGGGPSFAIKKEGAAQVALVGLPNSGKSMLLRWLTSARSEVADYPFTTRRPVPGMMRFEDIQIQFVEVPALIKGSSTGKGLGTQSLGVARNADAIALVIDVSIDPIAQVKTLLEEFEAAGIVLNQADKAEDKGDKNYAQRHATIIATKGDLQGAVERFERLKHTYEDCFPMVLVSAEKAGDPDELKRLIFDNLNIIRIYTKRPDKRSSERPLVLPNGSTVIDVAKVVHKDLVRDLKFAKVWGSTRFPGQQVPRDYSLRDKDIVELHA